MQSFQAFSKDTAAWNRAVQSFPNTLSDIGLYNSWFFVQEPANFMYQVLNTGSSLQDPSGHYASIREILDRNLSPGQIRHLAINFPDPGEVFLLTLWPEWGYWWTENIIKENPARWMKQTIDVYNALQTQEQKDEYFDIVRSNFEKYAKPDTTKTVPQTIAAKWITTFMPDGGEIQQAAMATKMGESQKLIGWVFLGLIGYYGLKTLKKKR